MTMPVSLNNIGGLEQLKTYNSLVSDICMLDWGNMAAYSGTLMILVLGPSLISIIYNYFYIFSMMRKVKSGGIVHDKEYATALSEALSNPNHLLSFMLTFTFILCWTPLLSVRFYELVTGSVNANPLLYFGLVWFGILNCFWKFVIMFLLSPSFRTTLKIFCLTICCKTRGKLQMEILGYDDD